MTSTNTNLAQALLAFAEQYITHHQKSNNGDFPSTEFDEEWLSPCINEKINDDSCSWQPVSIESLIAKASTIVNSLSTVSMPAKSIEPRAPNHALLPEKPPIFAI